MIAVLGSQNDMQGVSNFAHNIEVVVIFERTLALDFRNRDRAAGRLAVSVTVEAQSTALTGAHTRVAGAAQLHGALRRILVGYLWLVEFLFTLLLLLLLREHGHSHGVLCRF